MKLSKAHESGSMLLPAVSLLLIVFISGGIFFVVRPKHNDATGQASNTAKAATATNKSSPNTANSGILQQNSSNVARKNDASMLIASVAEFESNNNGVLPDAIQKNQLVGKADSTPSKIDLQMYKDAQLVSGSQAASNADVIKIVTLAVCANKGATYAAGLNNTRAYAVQYSQAINDGRFETVCMSP